MASTALYSIRKMLLKLSLIPTRRLTTVCCRNFQQLPQQTNHSRRLSIPTNPPNPSDEKEASTDIISQRKQEKQRQKENQRKINLARQSVTLSESDLIEKFVKGSGPGGQKINKCRHSVQLWHVPTGLFVETQRFRELSSNRAEARRLLLLKLDEQINKDVSVLGQRKSKDKRRDAKQRQRSRKKYGSTTDSDKQDSDEKDD